MTAVDHPRWCVPARCDARDDALPFEGGAHRSEPTTLELGPVSALAGVHSHTITVRLQQQVAPWPTDTWFVLAVGSDEILSVPVATAVRALGDLVDLLDGADPALPDGPDTTAPRCPWCWRPHLIDRLGDAAGAAVWVCRRCRRTYAAAGGDVIEAVQVPADRVFSGDWVWIEAAGRWVEVTLAERPDLPADATVTAIRPYAGLPAEAFRP